ncbi:MAG: hypothetical protein R6V11_09910 [Ectothiorhodospiraceae bacterium]
MKIGIIGSGRVGSQLAFTLVHGGIGDELVLYNRSTARAQGEALDLEHALAFTQRRMEISAGPPEAFVDADILVLCASRPLPAGATDRRLLGPENVALCGELLPQFAAVAPDACLVVVSNPVDVLTYYAVEQTGFPAERVLGCGTLVDSARFRAMISREVGINPFDLRAYVMGEHGPAQFPVMTSAQAGGERLENTPARQAMFQDVINAGYAILQNKGYTSHAVAMAASLLIEAIAHDTRQTFPVSQRLDGYLGERDVALSVPSVVGRNGVQRQLQPAMDDHERQLLRQAGDAVREAIQFAAEGRHR